MADRELAASVIVDDREIEIRARQTAIQTHEGRIATEERRKRRRVGAHG